LAKPFRSLADGQTLLDSRINYATDLQVSTERIFTLAWMVRYVEVLGSLHRGGRLGRGYQA